MRFENACPKYGKFPPSTNRRPNTTSSTNLQLYCNFNVHIFGTKHDIHNRGTALATRRGFLRRLRKTRTLVHKRIKIGGASNPPSINSAFYFIARLRRWRLANGTQPNFAKREVVDGADASRIKWRRIINVNETIETLASWCPRLQNILVSNGTASGGLKWQYIVNCHIF